MFFSSNFFQQIKRKLEDVGKKLEVLYDKLRENSVSLFITSVHLFLHFYYCWVGLEIVFFSHLLSVLSTHFKLIGLNFKEMY